MAGNAKPNIQNLGSEVTATIISSSGINGDPNGLFNGIQNNTRDGECYWYMTSYVELLIPKECNIWRSGSLTWNSYITPFIILKKNDSGGYNDVTSLYPQTLTAIDNTQWEKTISKIQSGQYRFSINGSLVRFDSEWYLEGIPINKFLIKQNNQYQSLKEDIYDSVNDEYSSNIISTLDIGKFDNYGIDDLSSIHNTALNKLIVDKYNIALLK